MNDMTKEKQSYFATLTASVGAIRIGQIVSKCPDIEILMNKVIEQAAAKAVNAAYGGERGDGGAMTMVNELAIYIKGVIHGSMNEMTHMYYYQIVSAEKLKDDPDYKKYLSLKSRFEHLEKT